MPSVLGATTAPVRVWGPVTLPILPRAKLSTRSIPRSWTSWGETIRAWSARLLAFTWPHLAKSATLVLAQNPRTAELIDNWSQIPAVVWPNLVLDWGTGQAGDGQTRDARLILCAGRLVGLKNQRHAISLLSSSSLSDFRLEIVGDGPLRDELYRLAQQIGVSDRVVFSGSLSREALLKRMDRAAVLVHPSIREGLGWVVGEATARGLPVAVTAGTGAEFALEWSNGPGKALPLTGDTSSDVEVWSSAVAELAGSGPYRPSERWSSERLRRQLAEWYGLHNAP
ncbi:glycosyltransferase [Geodermatophilus ruber]